MWCHLHWGVWDSVNDVVHFLVLVTKNYKAQLYFNSLMALHITTHLKSLMISDFLVGLSIQKSNGSLTFDMLGYVQLCEV